MINDSNPTEPKVQMNPFTEADWDCWSGADDSSGNQPYIGYGALEETSHDPDAAVVVIADDSGVTAYFVDSEGEIFAGYHYPCSPSLALLVASGLPYELSSDYLDDLGFNPERRLY